MKYLREMFRSEEASRHLCQRIGELVVLCLCAQLRGSVSHDISLAHSSSDGSSSKSKETAAAADSFLDPDNSVSIQHSSFLPVLVVSDVSSSVLPQCWRGRCPLARAERSSSRRDS